MMSGSIEKFVDRTIKYGAAFAEVSCPIFTYNEQYIHTWQLNPIAKAVFGVASVTFEVRARHLLIRIVSNASRFSC